MTLPDILNLSRISSRGIPRRLCGIIVVLVLLTFALSSSQNVDTARGSSSSHVEGRLRWVILDSPDGELSVHVVLPDTIYRDRSETWIVKSFGNASGNYTVIISIDGLEVPRAVQVPNATTTSSTLSTNVTFDKGTFEKYQRDAAYSIALSDDTGELDRYNGTINIFEYSPPSDSDETGIGYLFAAYLVIWGGLLAYVMVLARQYSHTNRDVDTLMSLLEKRGKVDMGSLSKSKGSEDEDTSPRETDGDGGE